MTLKEELEILRGEPIQVFTGDPMDTGEMSRWLTEAYSEVVMPGVSHGNQTI